MTESPLGTPSEPARGRFTAKPGGEADVESPKLDPTPEIIESMLELATDAQSILERGREHFDSESGRLERHAADAILIKFHELCDCLPDQVKDRHRDVPWDQIRGMRNLLGHHYLATDYRIVWNALEA